VPRSHGGAIAQTRSERASKHSYDSLLPGVNTPRSDEERNEQHDLMDFVPPTPHDSPLSGGHIPGSDEDLVINKLQKKGKMVEPKPTPKNPRKAHIQMDEELAQRLFKEEQAQFEREQMIARERAAE
ncbi:hypothetical protein Tco_1171939, partial [Tanacetum coccineum]